MKEKLDAASVALEKKNEALGAKETRLKVGWRLFVVVVVVVCICILIALIPLRVSLVQNLIFAS
jgi:hypothetical protein